MKALDPNHKGAIAEAEIAAAAIQLGIPVLKPVAEHSRYDLVFEIGGRLLRIQCKWAAFRTGVVEIRFVTNRRGPNGFIRTRYTADEIDAVAAYCLETDQCYLAPLDLVGERSSLFLRIDPPKNGQRASINSEAAFRLPGAVAQLERASGWQPEGRRFESDQLHFPDAPIEPGAVTVGANKFRNHFGLYMQRAAAGETFNVTRRGKAYVRLSAGSPTQLEVAQPEPADPPL